MLEVHVRLLALGRLLPALERLTPEVAERDDGVDVIGHERVEPLVPVVGDRGVAGVLLAGALPVDGVEVGVHHRVTARDPELRQEALHALARLADEDAVGYRLVLAGVLADDHDPGAAVEAPAVEDRAPLDPEVARWVHAAVGVVARERGKGVLHRPGVELRHRYSSLSSCWSAALRAS